MRVKVRTIITVFDGPETEPSMMEYIHSSEYTDNSRYYAHAIQCATGTAAQEISLSMEPKVDLTFQEPLTRKG